MDLWSDPNLMPYMAVTAHWLQVKVADSVNGARHELVLRSDLVGFYSVPTRHTGEHLCTAFVTILDRIGITNKVRSLYMHNSLCSHY